ncbi:MAG: nucleotidyltransferase family protein [Candidatus Latescibacteria bacterium]|nr:nucleotidyltransferase family protein [Candidatus Latescibacterota bacterium]
MQGNDAPAPAGIVLAAGLGTRMGAFKQLLPLGDRRLVEVVVDQLCGRLGRVVVVVGHRAEEVIRVLGDRPVQCAFNPDYRLGMSTSVQCGIRSAGPAAAYLICLGDQPCLAGLLDPLFSGAAKSSKGICIPTFQGRRGHPLLIHRRYAEEIMSLTPDQGLNTVTRAHPHDTLEVPVEESGALEDLDTPADYQQVLHRYRGEGHG